MIVSDFFLIFLGNALILKGIVVLEGQFSEEAQVLSFLRNSLLEIFSDQLKDKVDVAIESFLEKKSQTGLEHYRFI